MYHAKAAGKNRYVRFQAQMQDRLHERLRLESDISRALAREEFVLEYQPIVDLGNEKPAGCRGAGALETPNGGPIDAGTIHSGARGVRSY